jgi:glucose uptake protein
MLAMIFAAIAHSKLHNKTSANMLKGLIISLIAGILMGFFYRFIVGSMSKDFIHPTQGLLTPYTANVIFSIGLVVSSFIFNTWVMKKPFIGSKVSFTEYFKGSVWLHFIGILGGIIWGLGTLINLVASGTAGAAISYGLGQGATLIAALWGVLIWKEFNGAPKSTRPLLALMFLGYVVGLILIIIAKV